jgi:hypothetical protein
MKLVFNCWPGLVAALVLAGCGGGGDASPDAAAGDGWVLFTKIYTADGESSYVGPTGPFGPAAEFSTRTAIEVAGIASFYAPTTGGYFAIGDSEDFTVTRYDAGATGGLVPGAKVSFAPTGATGYLGNTMAFISPTKAYYIDAAQQHIVVWNPSTMQLESEISLASLVKPGFDLDVSLFHYVVRDDRFMFAAAWANAEARTALPVTALVVIDTSTDAIVSVDETDRCARAVDIVMGPDGDAYFGTHIYSLMEDSAIRGITRPGCVLRVRAQQESFDPAYSLLLSTATNGGVAYGLTATNDPARPYVWVLDESISAWEPVTGEDTLFSSPAWRLWRLDLTTGTAVRDDTVPAGAAIAAAVWYESNGRRFLVKPSADYSSSRVFEMLDSGPVQRISSTGFVLGLAQLR